MQEIKNEGWVKLYRKILKSDMWKALTSMQRDLVIAVLLKANHKPKRWEWEGNVFNCKAGEFITSIDSLIQACAKGTSVQNVRTGLKKLEKWEFLTYQSTKTGSKISIMNWHAYQIEDTETNKEINGQLTDSQQTANGQLTTNKNDKNVNNDKECKEGDVMDSDIRIIKQLWADTFRETKVPLLYKLTDLRIKKFNTRLKTFTIQDFETAILKAEKSSFLTGSTDWTITFDWLIANDNNMLKILEGNYDDKVKKTNTHNVNDKDYMEGLNEDGTF